MAKYDLYELQDALETGDDAAVGRFLIQHGDSIVKDGHLSGQELQAFKQKASANIRKTHNMIPAHDASSQLNEGVEINPLDPVGTGMTMLGAFAEPGGAGAKANQAISSALGSVPENPDDSPELSAGKFGYNVASGAGRFFKGMAEMPFNAGHTAGNILNRMSGVSAANAPLPGDPGQPGVAQALAETAVPAVMAGMGMPFLGMAAGSLPHVQDIAQGTLPGLQGYDPRYDAEKTSLLQRARTATFQEPELYAFPGYEAAGHAAAPGFFGKAPPAEPGGPGVIPGKSVQVPPEMEQGSHLADLEAQTSEAIGQMSGLVANGKITKERRSKWAGELRKAFTDGDAAKVGEIAGQIQRLGQPAQEAAPAAPPAVDQNAAAPQEPGAPPVDRLEKAGAVQDRIDEIRAQDPDLGGALDKVASDGDLVRFVETGDEEHLARAQAQVDEAAAARARGHRDIAVARPENIVPIDRMGADFPELRQTIDALPDETLQGAGKGGRLSVLDAAIRGGLIQPADRAKLVTPQGQLTPMGDSLASRILVASEFPDAVSDHSSRNDGMMHVVARAIPEVRRIRQLDPAFNIHPEIEQAVSIANRLHAEGRFAETSGETVEARSEARVAEALTPDNAAEILGRLLYHETMGNQAGKLGKRGGAKAQQMAASMPTFAEALREYSQLAEQSKGAEHTYGGPTKMRLLKWSVGLGAVLAAANLLPEDHRQEGIAAAALFGLPFFGRAKAQTQQHAQTQGPGSTPIGIQGLMANAHSTPPGPPAAGLPRPTSALPDLASREFQVTALMNPHLLTRGEPGTSTASSLFNAAKGIASRLSEQYGRFSSPEATAFYTKTGIVKGASQAGRIYNQLVQHSMDYLFGSKDAHANEFHFWEDAGRENASLWDVPRKLRAGMPLSREQLTWYAKPENGPRVDEFVKRAGDFLEESVAKKVVSRPRKNYDWPHTFGGWVDQAVSWLGKDKESRGPDQAAFDMPRTSEIAPYRNPVLQMTERVSQTAAKMSRAQLAKSLIELKETYEEQGAKKEAELVDEYTRDVVQGRPSWADKTLADILQRGSGVVKEKWAPGESFEATNKLYPVTGNVEVVGPAHVSETRGQTYRIKVDGKEWSHSLGAMELSILKASSSKVLAPLLHPKPASAFVNAIRKFVSFQVIGGNLRSGVTQLVSNGPRLFGGTDWKDFQYGALQATRHLFGQMDPHEMQELGQNGMAHEVDPGLHSPPAIPTPGNAALHFAKNAYFANVTVPETWFNVASYHASKQRLAREMPKGTPDWVLQDAAKVEAMKISDLANPMIRAPWASNPITRIFDLFQRPALRDLDQIGSMVRDLATGGGRGRGNAAIQLAKYSAARVGTIAPFVAAGWMSSQQAREMLYKTLPFYHWTTSTGYAQTPFETFIGPFTAVPGGVMKALWNLGDEIVHEGRPTDQTLRRMLPVGLYRMPTNIWRGLEHISQGEIEKGMKFIGAELTPGGNPAPKTPQENLLQRMKKQRKDRDSES